MTKPFERDVPFASHKTERPMYDPLYPYTWETAVVVDGSKTVRPIGEILTVAECPTDKRFCFVRSKAKTVGGVRVTTIRRDAIALQRNLVGT